MPVPLSYVKERRNMPFLKRGMRVQVDGLMGVVTAGNRSGNINVRFDGKKHSENVHPWWRTKYFDKDGILIKEYGD
ncbi:hypothetical protein EMIT07CA2_550120 [Brevibacillus sp. IT-7CA2]|uniref:hypothetical protein n=1 Tax=Brevibacillus sp. IT-7CA2 TaxID=3026436 RepID=UPI0039E08057